MTQNTPTLIPTTEELVSQFLTEVLDTVRGFEVYAEAYEALWQGFFEPLRIYYRWGDFAGQVELQGPRVLGLFVNWQVLYGFFRAWLRKQGIDPDTITLGRSLSRVGTAYEKELQ